MIVMKLGILLLTTALAVVNAENEKEISFTMCVPEIYWNDCIQMKVDSAKKGIPISCISGRDRYDCIDKVGRKEADIVAVDPEDMYLAAKNELIARAQYSVVEQIRTKEEPDAQYRYEAVVVVHKDLNIDGIQGLKGLQSCHTGVGRNVGYKIPITKLTAMGLLNINNPEYSARENELRALSTFFSKGCLVGTWSQDPAINRRLKETYSNMCALCEKPEVCDYPDIYSGYEGALRCLAHNGGDVAFTKVIYVKRFFGLPVGVTPAVPTKEDPTNFRYLCPDGTKITIEDKVKPCTWAARPWQGYMTNGEVADKGLVEVVQKELTDLGKLGEEENAEWWKDLMLLDDQTLAVAAPPVDPAKHLEDAQYMNVIERNSGAPEKDARWCVVSEAELAKCRALAKAAHSRDARPRLDCIQQKDENACLDAMRADGADFVVLNGGSVEKAIDDYNAKPILAESYGTGATQFNERPAVAVVKKDSTIKSLSDLRGKNSCHSGYQGDFAGWTAPVHALIHGNLVNSESEVSSFFAKSCVPGADKKSNLCEQCVGNRALQDEHLRELSKCSPTEAEDYKGGHGALRCLEAGNGDVAFMSLTALRQESGSKDSDYMLLCPSGGLAKVDEWQNCNFGLEPPRIIASFGGKTYNALEELTHGVLTATKIYSKNPSLLRVFGSWDGKPNLLFKDEAKSLVSVDNTWDQWKKWATTEKEFKHQ